MAQEEMTPLAQMMLDNSDIIDAEIEKYGPSVVAEFFVQAGSAIAAAYELGELGKTVKTDGTETKGQ